MKVRRAVIIVVNILLLMLMIALLVITVIGYTKYKDINQLVGNYFTIAFGVVMGIICLASLIAICAMCLSSSASYCCCVLYSLLALLIGVIFLGVGIASYVAIPIALGDTCTSHSIFNDVQKFSQLAENSVCVTCPCYFPDQIIQKTYSPQQIAQLTPQIPLANSIDSSLPVKAQDCFGWNDNQLENGYKILSFLQNKFKCTGWCSNTTSLFYRFTNVSNGIPQKTCYNSLIDTTNLVKQAIGIPAIVVGALNFISVFAFFFICCSDFQTPNSQATILQQSIFGRAIQNDMQRIPQFSQQTLNPQPTLFNTASGTAVFGTFANVKPQKSYY